MNPRIKYNPRRRRGLNRDDDDAEPENDGLGCARYLWLIMPLIAVAFVWVWRSRAAAPDLLPTQLSVPTAAEVVVTITPGPATEALATTAVLEATVTAVPTDIVLPTSTLLPAPSPSPTAIQTPATTIIYVPSPAILGAGGALWRQPGRHRGAAGAKGHHAADQLLVIPNAGRGGAGRQAGPEVVFSGAI
jgi:hypothetical protein